jgi:hypothetical protein
MVMKDSSVARPTYVLTRGAYDLHGEEVTFDVPKAIYPFDIKVYERNRLGLARWLTSKDNPLTARGFCKPNLAGNFWPWHCKNFRRFWNARRTSNTS